MKKNLFLVCLACCYAFSFTNCSKDDMEDLPAPDPVPTDTIAIHTRTNRTVLAYIIGDMNLWYSMEESLNLMEKGWDDTIDGSLLVYLDNSTHLTQFGQPVLLEITHDETDMIVSKVVKAYPDQDAGDPNIMQGVLNDAITLYPAESHGLIIGAHGNGWFPEITFDSNTKGLAGPERYASTLEIDALAKILPLKYDFILFHACNMVNVETAYQLRNKCEYLMGSVFALPSYAYPYDKIIPYFYTKPKADLYKSSLISYTEYETRDPATFNQFSVEVIKTSELENLAAATSKLLDDINMSYAEMRHELYKEREEMADTPIEDKNFVIDCYEDLGLLLDINGLSFLSDNDELCDIFETALNKVIIQHYVIGRTSAAWKMNQTNLGSGLSFYLPNLTDNILYNQLNSKFKSSYEWAKVSGFAKDR